MLSVDMACRSYSHTCNCLQHSVNTDSYPFLCSVQVAMQRVSPSPGFASSIPHAQPGETIPFEVPEAAPGDGVHPSLTAPPGDGVNPSLTAPTIGDHHPLPTVEEGAARLVRSPVKLLISGGPDGGQSIFLFKVNNQVDGIQLNDKVGRCGVLWTCSH